MTTRTGFQVLTEERLDWSSLPLRLLSKGNRKFWNPADLDFEQDAADWTRLPESYRRALTFQVAMFVAGEEAVAADIQPVARAISAEGRLGDALYLSQFAFEEARHTEVFCRWLSAVGLTEDLHGYVADNPGYRRSSTGGCPRPSGSRCRAQAATAGIRREVVRPSFPDRARDRGIRSGSGRDDDRPSGARAR